MGKEKSLIPVERIEKVILFIRGQKVMLDSDLATLYDVETKALNRAVKRNIERFPEDFMFQLTDEEWEILRCQFGTSSLEGETGNLITLDSTIKSWGGRRFPPYAFTEQGVAMLSTVLNSERAVKVNIEIMRAFVRLREILASNRDLARKLNDLEKKYDAQFRVVFDAIRELMTPPTKEQRRIGFRIDEK
ncbi:MAG: ORF6N domain-containing protein [bacterium]|nr:ORF6N domain-containing protein [bacterium]